MSPVDEPRCVHCNRVVDPNDINVFQRVVGWERKAFLPSRRGGSDIVLRENIVDLFSCQFCIDKLKAGVNVAQETLL